MSTITDVCNREILGSRGNPTVEIDVELDCGVIGCAAVPSGTSAGSHEALELRDADPKRYIGKGVLEAAEKVDEIIGPEIAGFDAATQIRPSPRSGSGF